MKKIISICMMCLFIALGTKAANTMLVLKNTEVNKTILQNLSAVESASVSEFEIGNVPLFWYCYRVSTVITVLGEDMEGNVITETTVTYNCFWINNNLQ